MHQSRELGILAALGALRGARLGVVERLVQEREVLPRIIGDLDLSFELWKNEGLVREGEGAEGTHNLARSDAGVAVCAKGQLGTQSGLGIGSRNAQSSAFSCVRSTKTCPERWMPA